MTGLSLLSVGFTTLLGVVIGLAVVVLQRRLGRRCLPQGLLVGIPAALIAVWCFACLPLPHGSQPFELARASTSDGVEMRLMSMFAGADGPFRVGLHYRREGQPWGWFYLGHGNFRWWFASIELDETNHTAVIRHGLKTVALFDWVNETMRHPGISRVRQGPDGPKSPDERW